MDSVASEGVLPEDYDWQPVINVFSLGAKVKPNDARLRFELGRLEWWQAQYGQLSAQQRRDHLQYAANSLQEVTKLRPLWGRAWVELANIQFQQKKYLDARQSLLHGMSLAKYDVLSHWMIYWTGFGIWGLLTPSEQDRFMEVVQFAVEYRYVDELLEAAVANYREALIEPLLHNNAKATQKLKQLLKARG